MFPLLKQGQLTHKMWECFLSLAIWNRTAVAHLLLCGSYLVWSVTLCLLNDERQLQKRKGDILWFCILYDCLPPYFQMDCKLPSCNAWVNVSCLVLSMFSCIRRTVCNLLEVQWCFYIYLALFLFIHVRVIWCTMSQYVIVRYKKRSSDQKYSK